MPSPRLLDWRPLPPLPNPVGIAGPFAGAHNGGLIVAGGANFAAAEAVDVWSAAKRFHDTAYVLSTSAGDVRAWRTGFRLQTPRAYGASASTPAGVVCIGGDDGSRVFADSFLLTWDPRTERLIESSLPPLPSACTAGGAAYVAGSVYAVGGQEGLGLASATDRLWRLDLSQLGQPDCRWEPLSPLPGGPRAYPLVAAGHNGSDACLYVIGGRRQRPGTTGLDGVVALADLHEFSPARFADAPDTGWRPRASPPTALMAGAAAALGKSHVVVLAADDGSLLAQAVADPEFPRRHPGFPRRAWTYDIRADTWAAAGDTPACPVTTPAVAFAGGIALVSGETRPRLRTPEAWLINRVGADE
jgi:SSS family solute:Na+ symporter